MDLTHKSLTVVVTHRPGVDVITVSGELDLYTAILLRDAIDDSDQCSAPVTVVDLNAITFLDSQGVACLATARRLVSGRGAELVIAVRVPKLRRLFKVTGLDQVLRVVPTIESFIDSRGAGTAGVVSP